MTASPAIATSLAYCWQLQRSDGIGLASISHDCSKRAAEREFGSEPDLKPVDLNLSSELFDSSLTFSGAFAPAGILRDDVKQGRWAEASVTLAMVDWQSSEMTNLCQGRLGRIIADGATFVGEVDVLPPGLKQTLCVQTSPECRAVLGDEHCRIAMRTRHRRVSIAAVQDTKLVCEEAISADFGFGQLRWISGANSGVDQSIAMIEDGAIILRDPPPAPVLPGDRALISQGCDGRLSTCAERFDNVANFRGEPYLPGTDSLIRYPGG